MTDDLDALKDDILELENVEENDDSENESVASDLYSISSHGVDQTAEVLVGKLKKRVCDLLCMSNSVHASKPKEHEDNDDYEGSFRRAAERR